MTDFAEKDLTHDAFLGGLLYLWQPRRGYRAGIDPVLLAASVPAKAGEHVLELGCGAGAAILCLAARVPGLTLTGVEREPQMAALAQRNGGTALEVICADLVTLPAALRERQFDHVIANPPYYPGAASVPSEDPVRAAARTVQTPLAKWVTVAAKRLVPKGYLTLIHRAERLPDLMRALPSGMGSLEVLPLTAREGRNADRVILRARKNGRSDFRLHAPLIMHEGPAHVRDGESYVPQVRDILRRGAPLIF